MKQTKHHILWLAAFLLGAGSIQAFGKPFANGPYLGQTPPGSTAKVFAPRLICRAGTGPLKWEGNGSFSADGNTFCFQRINGVFVTENTNQGWTTPERIDSIPPNVWSPWSPCLSPDANSIFFTIAIEHPWIKHYNLYRCNRTASGWTKPQEVGPPFVYSGRYGGFSLAANNSIYFWRSKRKVGGSGGGTFYAPYENNTWTGVIKLPLGDTPGIAPDESFMVLTAKDLPGGYGHRDLYLTRHLPDGTWSKPRNLGPRINSAHIEHSPRISPDKKYLFFNRSNGWDPRVYGVVSDIYWVELKEYLPESFR